MAETKRGRPRLDPNDRRVPVNLRVPAREYDELYMQARRQEVTIPELIRRALREKKQA